MKLTKKLSITLLLLLLCVLTVGIFSLYQMRNINLRSTELSNVWLPSIVNIQRLSTLLSDFRRHEINHVYNVDPQVMAEYSQKMQRVLDKITKHMDEYRTVISVPEEEQGFRTVENLWKLYLLINAETIHLSQQGRQEEAVALLQGKSRDIFNALDGELGKIVSLDVTLGKEAGLASDQMYHTAVMLVNILLFVCVLLTVLLGLYMRRAFLRTLGRDPEELGALARQVALGELDVPQDAKAVGVYADILIMVEKIREYISSVETLTANIPGGVQCCLPDNARTIHYVSDGFVDLFGYSREELQNIFQNEYSRMLEPEERETVSALIRGQLALGAIFEAEYAVMHKDGHAVWVLERGRQHEDMQGKKRVYCVLTDLTALKNARELRILQEEQCRAALCATHDCVFECDLDQHFILSKGQEEWVNAYGTLPASYAEVARMTIAQCHAEDMENVLRLFSLEHLQNPHGKLENRSLEYRLFDLATGQYLWLHTTLIPFMNADGSLNKIFGCTQNISERKKLEHAGRTSSQSDMLTGLLNKSHAEGEIMDFLVNEGKSGSHALFVLDIDNFKAINENLGHLFGDALLTKIAHSLQGIVRSEDILGRLGGDEFIILVKNIDNDTALLERIGSELCAMLQSTVVGDGMQYELTGSIGIALFPHDGNNYLKLFQNADAALYYAKQHGKKRYSYYDEFMQQQQAVPAQITDIAPRAENKEFKDDVLAYIFEMLYEARDVSSVINIALGMIGAHYDVSRAYVFQNSNDDSMCSNTFEWCNEGILSQQDSLQNISYADTGSYRARYTRDGVFYCDDTSTLDPQLQSLLAPQGIRSMLHLAIYDAGKFRGYVGFDECSGKRLWTKDEISMLSTLAKVLGVFLLKNDIARQLAESYQNSKAIIDSMDIWAYVIDEQSFELLYVNAKTIALTPRIRVGVPCHLAIFESPWPCSFCPRAGLDDGTGHSTLEIYNADLDLWVLSTAARIPWSDTSSKTAILVSCVDVTPYKRPKALESSVPAG